MIELGQLQIRIDDKIRKLLQEEADRRLLSLSDVAREKILKGLGLPIG